ncbi:hypothetical protein ACWZJV_14550 [Nocardioides sp. WG-D5]
MTFVDACLSGDALLEDVDDWVDQWHEADVDATLDEYLGFTDDEGALWAEKPQALRFIVAAHRHQTPVAQILTGRDDYALAARSNAEGKAEEVLDWLRETNQLAE